MVSYAETRELLAPHLAHGYTHTTTRPNRGNQTEVTAILGISAYYHDSAAALVVDGKIVAAVQEERFTRRKHDPAFPAHSIRYLLEVSQLDLNAIDQIVFYDKPLLKFERLLETYLATAPHGLRSFLAAMPIWLKEKLFLKTTLRRELSALSGVASKALPPLLFTEHHQSHAASAFFPSPFDEAEETGAAALALAGGVALNCVANGKLLRERIFDRLWISLQPVAHWAQRWPAGITTSAMREPPATGTTDSRAAILALSSPPQKRRPDSPPSGHSSNSSIRSQHCWSESPASWPVARWSAGFRVEWSSARVRLAVALSSVTLAHLPCRAKRQLANRPYLGIADANHLPPPPDLSGHSGSNRE